MIFPEAPRVIYKKNPLDQVICQVKFPPILRIDADIPFEFQEIIRSDFPNYSSSTMILADLIPDELIKFAPKEFSSNLQQKGNVNHQFSTDDGAWAINLTNNFLSISTSSYTKWEDFKHKFEAPLNAFISIYSPPHFNRIGLRYIDLITRSSLGLTNRSWNELIQPYILGIQSNKDIIPSSVRSSLQTDEITLNSRNDIVRLIHGLAIKNDDQEILFVIDSDIFSESKTEVLHAIKLLNEYNLYARNIFRWSIKTTLHEAMEPTETK